LKIKINEDEINKEDKKDETMQTFRSRGE